MVQVNPANQGQVRAYWILTCGIPKPQNPMLDTTGNSQPVSAPGPLQLSGGRGATYNRRIPQNIPSNRPIFIAVNPVIVTEPEAGTSNSNELTTYAREDESASSATLTINGQLPSENVLTPNHRIATTLNVTFPNNPIFGSQSGTFPAAANGYYAIVSGLNPGTNTIAIHAQVDRPFPKFNESKPWVDDVTYTLTIQ